MTICLVKYLFPFSLKKCQNNGNDMQVHHITCLSFKTFTVVLLMKRCNFTVAVKDFKNSREYYCTYQKSLYPKGVDYLAGSGLLKD